MMITPKNAFCLSCEQTLKALKHKKTYDMFFINPKIIASLKSYLRGGGILCVSSYFMTPSLNVVPEFAILMTGDRWLCGC